MFKILRICTQDLGIREYSYLVGNLFAYLFLRSYLQDVSLGQIVEFETQLRRDWNRN